MVFSLSSESKYKKKALTILFDLILLLFSSILFTLSFPSVVSRWGLSFFAFIAIVPVFIVVHRSSWISIFMYGFFYGFSSYAIFNYWLAAFHPLALLVVPVIYSVYFFILFPVLKIIDLNTKKYTYFFQVMAWLGYEYLRTKAFLGYPYGILGYSQYLNTTFISISDLGGVWVVSFLVILPSAFIANALKTGCVNSLSFFREHKLDVFIYFALIMASLIYGRYSTVDYSDSKKIKIALIQHNVDPRKGGYAAYRNSLEKLKVQSDKAIEYEPEMLVWPETAFVPAIHWHKKFRRNRRSYELVADLEKYLIDKNIPVVLGNDDGRLSFDSKGREKRLDYNAAVLFDDKKFKEVYRKMHLVPFSEHFPYKKLFPWMYSLLVENDTHFWKKGNDVKVFQAAGVKFSTPICFEDSFGYISRKFVKKGAEVIVNITNDSWSKSIPSEMQHMAMAVFRSVENRVSMVRSTNGGITCQIDPNGKIVKSLSPFIESFLICDVPVYSDKKTIYLKYGDFFGYGAVYFTILLMVFFIIRYLWKKD